MIAYRSFFVAGNAGGEREVGVQKWKRRHGLEHRSSQYLRLRRYSNTDKARQWEPLWSNCGKCYDGQCRSCCHQLAHAYF